MNNNKRSQDSNNIVQETVNNTEDYLKKGHLFLSTQKHKPESHQKGAKSKRTLIFLQTFDFEVITPISYHLKTVQMFF